MEWNNELTSNENKYHITDKGDFVSFELVQENQTEYEDDGYQQGNESDHFKCL